MEKSDNKLPTDEKADLFEYVNSVYLKLTGEKKKYTKRCFKHTWKEDNMCYKLLMGYNKVYDVWLENERNAEWVWERDNLILDGRISQKKHHRVINMLRESEHELELELEKIKEGKGYISEEKYKEDMREKDKQMHETRRQTTDRVAKYINENDMLREKLDHNNKRLEAQKLYYEDQIKKLSMD